MFDKYFYADNSSLFDSLNFVGDKIQELKKSNDKNAEEQIKQFEAINQTLREAYADKIRENQLKEKQRIAKIKTDFIVQWREANIKCGDRVVIECDENKSSFLIYKAKNGYLDNGEPKAIDVYCFGNYWNTGFLDKSSANIQDLAKEIADWLEPKQEIKLIDHYASNKIAERNLASNLTFLNEWQTFMKIKYKPYGFDNKFSIKYLLNDEYQIKNFVVTTEGRFCVAVEDYALWGSLAGTEYRQNEKIYANSPIELGEQIAKKYSYIDLSYKAV